MKRILPYIFIPFVLAVNIISVRAQDTLKVDNSLYYRLTIGGGFGGGNSIPEDGIGANIEFALQKQKSVFAVSVRGMEEFMLFSNSNVVKSITSADITYGIIFKRKALYTSISAGVGWVTNVQEGKLLSREGGWLFSSYTYEKLTYHNIDFPISAKIFWVPLKFYGIGVELFVNINKNTFYGINFCHQFGKLRPANIKNKQTN